VSLSSIVIPNPRGELFTFEKAGDVLPMHTHDENAHITMIMRGRFRIHGPGIGDKEYGEGAFIDWAPGVTHEFVALTDNARMANISKIRQVED